MTRDEVFARVRGVLIEQFDLDANEVQLDSHLIDDLNLDSIDAIDMAVYLQNMTGRRVEEKELRSVRTVRDVVDLVCRHFDAGGASRPTE